MLCAYMRPRYQVSIYRTIGPLVFGNPNPTEDDNTVIFEAVHTFIRISACFVNPGVQFEGDSAKNLALNRLVLP